MSCQIQDTFKAFNPAMAIRRYPRGWVGRPSPQNFEISNPNLFANPDATPYNSANEI